MPVSQPGYKYQQVLGSIQTNITNTKMLWEMERDGETKEELFNEMKAPM
jgi:hypothetical protein